MASRGLRSALGAATILLSTAATTACSQTPVVVPVRSMERAKDVDFICLQVTADGYRGAPIDNCGVDASGNPTEVGTFHLHAVVTQVTRGELAVVDLGQTPADTPAITKVDPRLPGFTFLPVGAVPSDVATDPLGNAVYVASGRDRRIDIIPAEMIRGPVDVSKVAQDKAPWPHLDLSVADGTAASLAVVRDPVAKTGRLYAVLADASTGPKIAVFDVTTTPLAPARLADIPLSLSAVSPLPLNAPACGNAGKTPPWWVDYDTCFAAACSVACPTGTVCRGGTCVAILPKVDVVPATRHHLAGIAVAGNRIFAADDLAPYVHVFDLASGAEVQRLGVGSPTVRVAVSEPVPDEARNPTVVEALDECESRGWVGDGKDHSTESAKIKELLGGRCRAHRYVYAITGSDPKWGDGALVPIDVEAILVRGTDGAIVDEIDDLAGASVETPMACESPTIAPHRVALGTYGLAGLERVPARAVAFVTWDPPSTNGYRGLRCFAKSADASASKRLQDRAALADGNQGPKRLRGTYALAALSNGTINIVDIDDLDSGCRGQKDASTGGTTHPDPFGQNATPIGANASGEYYDRPVRRHHPRSAKLFSDDVVPALSVITFSSSTTTLAVGDTTLADPTLPSLVTLPDGIKRGDQTLVAPAADNAYGLSSESWTTTFEGLLQGYSGVAGSFVVESGTTVLRDPAGAFCTRGVEAEGKPLAQHDFVQITDDVCDVGAGCDAATHQQCLSYYGLPTDVPLNINRDLTIGTVFEDHVTLPAPPKNLKACFPGLTRYVIRGGQQWIVVGSTTGFLHRQKPADPTVPGSACALDTTKPAVFQGRIVELANGGKAPAKCEIFRNTSWAWMIRAGTSPSLRDMHFTFSTRFSFVPLGLSGGTLPTTIKPLRYLRNGVDLLGWNSFVIIDAIDRGLQLVSLGDLTTAKVVN